VSDLKGLFQNPGRDIKTEDYAIWNMELAKVFKGLQDMQLGFAVAFTSGDRYQGVKEVHTQNYTQQNTFDAVTNILTIEDEDLPF